MTAVATLYFFNDRPPLAVYFDGTDAFFEMTSEGFVAAKPIDEPVEIWTFVKQENGDDLELNGL